MNEKKSLSQAFKDRKGQPEKDTEAQAVSEYPKKRSQLPKSRKEKRSLTGWYRIHSTNPVWVALLRDGNPTPFSATLPL